MCPKEEGEDEAYDPIRNHLNSLPPLSPHTLPTSLQLPQLHATPRSMSIPTPLDVLETLHDGCPEMTMWSDAFRWLPLPLHLCQRSKHPWCTSDVDRVSQRSGGSGQAPTHAPSVGSLFTAKSTI
jgi:hypothetical protein